MLVNTAPHHRNGRPPQRVLLTLVGVAVLLHAALLSGVQLGLPQPERSTAAAVQVRMLKAPEAVVAVAPPDLASSVAVPTKCQTPVNADRFSCSKTSGSKYCFGFSK